jgi:5'(3')-deoxyribonucleotidase
MQAIGVDFDDTIVDYVKALLKELEKEHGIKARFEDITKWHISDLFPGVLDDDKVRRLFIKAWKDEYLNMKLVDPKLPSIINRLRKDFLIYITTASFATDTEITQFLKSFGIGYDKLVHVRHHNEKLLDEISIYIDDNPNLAKEFAEAGKYVVVFERPWNKALKAGGRIIKAPNWEEIEKEVLKLASAAGRASR